MSREGGRKRGEGEEERERKEEGKWERVKEAKYPWTIHRWNIIRGSSMDEHLA